MYLKSLSPKVLSGDSTRTVAPHSEDEDDHTLAHTLALANCRILNIKTPKHKREQTYFNNNLLNLEEKKNTYRMA